MVATFQYDRKHYLYSQYLNFYAILSYNLVTSKISFQDLEF